MIVSGAVKLAPPNAAVIVADSLAVTVVVETEKLAEVLPLVTVTVFGTCAKALEDCKLTATPEGPAAPLNVTLPLTESPPTMEAGFTESEVSPAGFTVNGQETVIPLRFADIVPVVGELTPLVV